ncbi:stage III sporulation protein AE [Paenibacillus mesotrionivorans]|jgi:stage III sporulation protein AE|uniref:Stage III sporulation protein AE n=1 Tax=Paenibacillus mesotrionivorans TaxID=3160968 RepID=A0ACC7P1W9_9BACL
MKRIVFLAVCFALFLLLSLPAYASAGGNPADAIITDQTEKLPTGQVEQYWSQMMKEYGAYFPSGETPKFKDLVASGNQAFSFKSILSAILKFFFHEVLQNGRLLASIVILTVFSMILESLQSAFERQSVSKIGYAICYMVLIVIAINSFNIAIEYAKTAIGSMINFMIAIIPLLLTLMASMGNVTSVTMMHPLIVFMINTMGSVIYYVVFPLLFFSVVLHIASSLSEKYKVTQLAKLLQKGGVVVLGVMSTIFLGVLSVRGISGSVADGVGIRTAKYITSNFVPVVGKMFSDASDTVIGASLLVKNAIGLAGVVILVSMCAFPAIKILTMAVIYHVSAAVLQPLGDSPIVKTLSTIGKSLVYVFAALAAVGFLFFLAITILIAASNVSVMVR